MDSSRSSLLKHDMIEKSESHKMAFQKPSYGWTISLIILHVICCKPALGNWSVWGEWSSGPCSVTCGNGNRSVTRERFCNNPENNCNGDRQDKKSAPCQTSGQCGDLDCYECNIFRSGKIVKCDKEMTVEKRCRACMKSYTKIGIHDRIGYAKDSIVVSRLCIHHEDFNDKSSEECEYHRSNGGISIVCHCFSDRCNNGVRHGASLGLWVFMVLVWTQFKGLLVRPQS